MPPLTVDYMAGESSSCRRSRCRSQRLPRPCWVTLASSAAREQAARPQCRLRRAIRHPLSTKRSRPDQQLPMSSPELWRRPQTDEPGEPSAPPGVAGDHPTRWKQGCSTGRPPAASVRVRRPSSTSEHYSATGSSPLPWPIVRECPLSPRPPWRPRLPGRARARATWVTQRRVRSAGLRGAASRRARFPRPADYERQPFHRVPRRGHASLQVLSHRGCPLRRRRRHKSRREAHDLPCRRSLAQQMPDRA